MFLLTDRRPLAIGALFVAELAVLALSYQLLAQFECRGTNAFELCRFLRSMVVRALAVFAAMVVLVWARPEPFARFLAGARASAGPHAAMLLHLAGIALLMAPLAVFGGDGLTATFGTAAVLWIAGGLAAAVGGLLWLAPLAEWRSLLRDTGALLPVVALAALIPDMADLVQPLWHLQAITTVTFAAVVQLLDLVSDGTYADPASYVIGVRAFVVVVSQQCSGVEGFALVTVFCALYAFLFRDTIRPLRLLLVVWPVALALSWVLNIVRIAALILIGAHVSPDLAVNGFHSYAGWMFFTLLALGILYAVQAIAWFHRDGPARSADGPALRDDPVAVQILPFVAFMVGSVLAGALAVHPDLAYPVKVAAMGAAVLVFLPAYRRLPWSVDPVAVAVGLAVGAGWLWLDPGDPAAPALSAGLAAVPAALLAGWIALRVIGTVVLVPLIEEMFFRGYVLTRIDRGGLMLRIVAIAVSSALFAALHGRWIEAGLAGVAFALVMLRRGRVTDAVVSHAAANAVVALGAALAGDWTRI